MHLILRTSVKADLDDAAYTSCVAIEVTPALLDVWEQFLDEAQDVRCLYPHPDLVLSWTDWTPDAYQGTPDDEAFDEAELDNKGWTLMTTEPFAPPLTTEGRTWGGGPDDEEHAEPWHQPVALCYSEIHVGKDGLCWVFAPKCGIAEEDTAWLSRAALATIRSELGAIQAKA